MIGSMVAWLFGSILGWLGWNTASEEGGLTFTGVLLWIFGMAALCILGWFVLGQSGVVKAFVSVVKELFKTVRLAITSLAAPIAGLFT